ncbi:RICIN domain-containing protein [Streptomyces sp. NPDC050844]|uniref:RICIN domain-containing protein n=1 Tax=Streptomyces sp. NPDC050844 TaxID=3155790 RepID=UPI0033DDCB69
MSLPAVLTVLATLLASLALGVLPAAPAHAAPLASTPLITYNLQGAQSGGDNKWRSTIGNYGRLAEIVAVQEAGPNPPPPAYNTTVNPIPMPQLPQNQGRRSYVTESQWRYEHETYTVYFLQTDENGGTWAGGRNNLAIVTQRTANDVDVIDNPDPEGRPILGVRYDNDWYFNFHGRSLGRNRPNDSQAVITRVQQWMTQNQPGRHWHLMGDYNQEPRQVTVPQGLRRYNTNQPTHQNGSEYDWMMSDVDIQNHPVQRLAGATADHYAVGIGGLRASAEPARLYNSPRVIENMQNGGALEAVNEGTDPGTSVSTFQRTGRANQQWNPEFFSNGSFRLRLGDTERCMTIRQGDGFRFHPQLGDCFGDGEATPHWRLHSLGNDQFRIQSTYPGLTGQCLDVRTSREPGLNPGEFYLNGCADVDGQDWTIGPTDHPSTTEAPDTDDLPLAFDTDGLTNAANGQLLTDDRIGSYPGPVTLPHRTQPAPNLQEWSLAWESGGMVRIRDDRSDRCLAMSPGAGDWPARTNMAPCAAVTSQYWRVVTVGENVFRLVNQSAREPRCLSSVRAGENRSLTYATRCETDLPSSRWYFGPASPSDGADPDPGGGA